MTDYDIQRITDTFLLALVVWREARGEPHDCRVAVACSILNRVKRPSWWGSDVQGVVTKKWQYSSMTAPNDPQLTKFPARSDTTWLDCMTIADDVLRGRVVPPFPGADSYHDISIPAPNWATPAAFVGQLGRIRFFNLDNDVEANAVPTQEGITHG
jgi:spore germination cell wall hydrolase CwlJ-like protein